MLTLPYLANQLASHLYGNYDDDVDHRRAQAPAFSTLAELEELMAWGINMVKDPDGAYYPDGAGTESYWLPYR